jgi:chromosome segregation ATPase
VKLTEDLRDEASRQREELDSLLEKIRQAKSYNDAMKSEVAVTRTVANKTGEDLKARAKGKLDQDTYIDGLNRQVTRLEDEIALSESQLRVQKEQSSDAAKMIRETRVALDTLAGEQKQLVQQWNASVVALGKRDQALFSATKALRKVQDSIKDIENENARLGREIAVLREGNAGVVVSKDRLENEFIVTDNNAKRVQSNLVELSGTVEMLQEALMNANHEEKTLTSAVSKIESEITALNQKCELLIRERQAIEDKISTTRREQSNMSDVAQSLAKQEKSILVKIHDKEIESATILNEIARLDIERLNTQAHNTQLEKKLGEELVVMKEAEALIDEKEMEIRNCIDEVEKKTIRVAKLNREYNKMLEDCEEEEPVGPLEATIKNLSKKIDQETSDIRGLQREWLMRQTELINITSNTNAIQETDSEANAKLGILRQKLLRLIQENHTNESALKSIEYKSRGLHTDMTRLNDLIAQNSRRRTEYENVIAVNVIECERELIEIEQQSRALDGQLVELQSNRTKILGEITDIEEKIKEYEKKIQVEKEVQDELCMSKDAIDTKGMEKEISKMKRRLESLATMQEQLLRDMELAIQKREDIAVKYSNRKINYKH